MTPEQIDGRCQRIYQIGCIACRLRGWVNQCQVHHLNLGGHAGQVRRGDEFTIGLCPWHHVGEPIRGLTAHVCRMLYGPSLKVESRRFREEFGDDDTLLARVDARIAVLEKQVAGAAQ